MREMIRKVAKAKLRRMGYKSHINRTVGQRWREVMNAYPIDIMTGERMPKGYIGRKRYEKGQRNHHLFRYSA